jgi:hypothetical protein
MKVERSATNGRPRAELVALDRQNAIANGWHE